NALQRHTQHLVHLAVTLGGLKETNAAVVGVVHLPGKLVLPQLTLCSPAESSRAEREPRHLDAGLPERDPIRSGPARRPQRQPSGSREYPRGESGLQEIASGEVSHLSASNRPYPITSDGSNALPWRPLLTPQH